MLFLKGKIKVDLVRRLDMRNHGILGTYRECEICLNGLITKSRFQEVFNGGAVWSICQNIRYILAKCKLNFTFLMLKAARARPIRQGGMDSLSHHCLQLADQ